VNAKTLLLPLAALLALAAALLAAPQPPAAPEDPLAIQVNKAIDKGVKFLRNHSKDGRWEPRISIDNHPGGATALALLALLNSGVKADDPMIRKGMEYLRGIDKPTNYVRALQTMVYVQAGLSEDNQRILANVEHFLTKSAIYDNNKRLSGWGYDRNQDNGFLGAADASNTQFTVLALWMAARSGVQIPPAIWEQVRELYTRTQLSDGGWSYAADGTGGGFERGSYISMTMAGLSGLLLAQMELSAADKNRDPVAGCGVYPENKALQRGLAWIHSPPPGGHDHFSLKLKGRTFYNLYGIERVGRLSGQRFLGPHDWYREGCTWLVQQQNKTEGSWSQSELYDPDPILSTSFALLFLSKGKTPVLVSKLAHGKKPRADNDQDWNRRRNDLRNLVEYTSIHVFGKKPLAWQVFDVELAAEPKEGQFLRPEDLHEITSELLQSPVAYITGHQSPKGRFTQREEEILKQYVENGGFIFAAACCGDDEFSKGFEKLCEKLWPTSELALLGADHPIWTMKFSVKPGSFGLKGIQMGCKTVVVLATENMTGYWELNRHDDKGKGEAAFQLAANIFAYATGMEAPKERGTVMPVNAKGKGDDTLAIRRGYFRIGQLVSDIGEEAEWKPAPEAMTHLAQSLRDKAGLDVILKTADVAIDAGNLTDYKFLYMHGRKDFKFPSERLAKLRFNLKNGGLLLADACCGKEAFDTGFRLFIKDLFPREPGMDEKDVPRLVPIPPDDELYSKELNGEALNEANIWCRLERGKEPQKVRPMLEGVKIGKRWVVIYSKYDIGCALERHQSADCRGYSYESARALAQAAVLYQFRP
jgi:hypothetical protein